MALQVSGTAVQTPVPLPAGGAAVVFQELCVKFNIDSKVADFLVKDLGLESLDDFRTVITATSQVESVITNNIQNLPKANLQAARLRQAWEAIQAANDSAILTKKRVIDEVDLDTPLPTDELKSMKEAFWQRYKLTFSAGVEPSDSLVSRVSRELSKRMLTVFPVLKVRTLTHQVLQEKKRTKIADKLSIELQDDEEVADSDVASYLRCLWTFLIAVARAGVHPLNPQPVGPEVVGSDSTLYVEAPLDVLLAYHTRATRSVAQVAISRQFDWLKSRDEAERQQWIERHRGGSSSIGAVVAKTSMEREALWLVSEADRSHAGIKRQPSEHLAPSPKPTKQAGGKLLTVATTLDGQPICSKWNVHQCREPCPEKKLHVCNAQTKVNGRACGLRNHTSTECRHGLRK